MFMGEKGRKTKKSSISFVGLSIKTLEIRYWLLPSIFFHITLTDALGFVHFHEKTFSMLDLFNAFLDDLKNHGAFSKRF